MDKYKLICILAIIISLISIGLGVNQTMKFNSGEWLCISERCAEIVEGQEWVQQNCNPTGPSNEMICEFRLGEDVFNVPLSGINISNMQGCTRYECDSEVFVRRSE